MDKLIDYCKNNHVGMTSSILVIINILVVYFLTKNYLCAACVGLISIALALLSYVSALHTNYEECRRFEKDFELED